MLNFTIAVTTVGMPLLLHWKYLVCELKIDIQEKKMCSNFSVQMCLFQFIVYFLNRTLLFTLEFGYSAVLLCSDPFLGVNAPISQLLRAHSCISRWGLSLPQRTAWPQVTLLGKVVSQLVTGCYGDMKSNPLASIWENLDNHPNSRTSPGIS